MHISPFTTNRPIYNILPQSLPLLHGHQGAKPPGARLQQPAPSGISPLPPAWKVTVPSLLMVQLRMPQNMADRLASTVGSDTAAGQVTQLQHLLSPSSERRDLVFTLLASR
ncbi:hypothetical protein BKA60DRAFT_624082 [Fusarium oxysporum]|uniref:Uncharacterized protein n=1 Tax=Fusarium oxysporum TaxID=5507 RepID=A0A420MVP6_FUSOX|nr:hypothetical protein BKA60DRAFT_624082 [Fusarium oxysporum]RKK72106.1 hypothetical protein BFJ69_g10369 [Fusarium oxysporum]